jgi:hypothetical protein
VVVPLAEDNDDGDAAATTAASTAIIIIVVGGIDVIITRALLSPCLSSMLL